jgi:hypothetical protein
MHVIGARFVDREAAGAALATVRARVPVARADVAVRPLGSTSYDAPIRGFLLAGRFADEWVDVVVRTIRELGGDMLEQRAEWTHTLAGGALQTLNGRNEWPGGSRRRPRHGREGGRTSGVATGHVSPPRSPRVRASSSSGPRRRRRRGSIST